MIGVSGSTRRFHELALSSESELIQGFDSILELSGLELGGLELGGLELGGLELGGDRYDVNVRIGMVA